MGGFGMNSDKSSLGGGFGMEKSSHNHRNGSHEDPSKGQDNGSVLEDDDIVETVAIDDYLELRQGEDELEVFYLGIEGYERALYIDLESGQVERTGESFDHPDCMNFLEKTFEYLEQDGEIENAYRALEEVNYHA